MIRWPGAFLLLAVIARPSMAQVIRGRTVDSISHAAVSGALVELHDAEGKTLLQVFTGPDGAFGFVASAPGRYQIRVAAIGYARHAVVNIDVGADPVAVADIRLTPVAVSLPELQALAGKRACGKSELNAETFGGLLESARTSLQLMDAALKSHDLAFETQTIHTLTLHHDNDSSVRADTAAATVHEWPIRSLSIDSLQKVGFQRPMTASEGGGHIWYGPDLEVLFSEWFLDTHCFTLDKALTHGDSVVIRFDPEGHPRHVDLSGELVLDRPTLTLRRLQYAHRNIPDGVPDRAAGGDMIFSELSPGFWIPQEWSIWAPITATQRVISRPLAVMAGQRTGRPVSRPSVVTVTSDVVVVGRDEVRGHIVRVVPAGT